MVKSSFSGLIIGSLIIYTGWKNNDRTVDDISISIREQEGIFFTNQREIMHLMTLEESDNIKGTELNNLVTRTLEERIEQNSFVGDVQVYHDLKGNLKVEVTQNKPIARLLSKGKNEYIDDEGNTLPMHAKYTARVPLIEVESTFDWKKSTYGKSVFRLLKYIAFNEFWNAQIAHIVIKKNGEIELLPQVTKQKILFGKPENIKKKFKKLMIFYKKILPYKGWNNYNVVNLKFENQIICK